MIFRWLHVRRTKSLWKDLVTADHLDELLRKESALTEREAFIRLIPMSVRQLFWNAEDYRRYHEALAVIERTSARLLKEHGSTNADKSGL